MSRNCLCSFSSETVSFDVASFTPRSDDSKHYESLASSQQKALDRIADSYRTRKNELPNGKFLPDNWSA